MHPDDSSEDAAGSSRDSGTPNRQVAVRSGIGDTPALVSAATNANVDTRLQELIDGWE